MQQISRGKFDRLQRTTAGFTCLCLDGYGLRCSLPARPRRQASYPVLVHRRTPLLHASFRPRLATTPLRFANPSPPPGWIRDLHPQTVEHARHTMTPGKERQAWKSHSRFPHSQTIDGDWINYYFFQYLPGLLANYEMAKRSNPAHSKPVKQDTPSKAVDLSRTRAQRIPIEVMSSLCSNKDRIHLRRPHRHLKFSLAARRRTI